MQQINDKIIAMINDYKARKINSFSLMIHLEPEQRTSRALLHDAIKHCETVIFPANSIRCDKVKVHSHEDKKAKCTYFYAMLYCRIVQVKT